MAGGDGDAAATAAWELADRPAQAVALLRAKLKPAAAADEATVRRLVARLDAPGFADREAAGKELASLGDAAVTGLRAAVAGGLSAEQGRRVEVLLSAAAARVLPPGDRLRHVRAVAVLARAGTPAARALLKEWAAGTAESVLTKEAKVESQRLGP